jgi:hypothetical protein
MSGISQVVRQLKLQRTRGARELAIKALTSIRAKSAPTRSVVRSKPKFTAAGIVRIRAAQKARWANIKAAKR